MIQISKKKKLDKSNDKYLNNEEGSRTTIKFLSVDSSWALQSLASLSSVNVAISIEASLLARDVNGGGLRPWGKLLARGNWCGAAELRG